MRIIFLDFDGVITRIGMRKTPLFMKSENSLTMFGVDVHQTFNRAAVERLARLAIICQAKIVFITAWRDRFSPDELCQMLRAIAHFPKGCFLGYTPILGNARRGLEINAWLEVEKSKNCNLQYAILLSSKSDEYWLPPCKTPALRLLSPTRPTFCALTILKVCMTSSRMIAIN